MSKNTIYLAGGYSVAIDGNDIDLSREIVIKRGHVRRRPLIAKELPLCERMFRRVLEEMEPFYAPLKQFEPLDIDVKALLELLALLLVNVPQKIRQKAELFLRLAVEKPGTWLHKYGHRRGLKKPSRDLHVLAFLDAMIVARAAGEPDHRVEPEELAAELRRIGRRLGFTVQTPQDAKVSVALKTLSRSLNTIGWALVPVEIHSDSYPFLVVPKDKIRRVQALMRKLKIQVKKL